MRRIWLLCCATALAAAFCSSCGNEAPWEKPGNLVVESTPAGASIAINGEDTGEVTPHTFAEIVPTQYVVTLTMPGSDLVPEPASRTVIVGRGETVTASFAMVRDVGSIAVTSDPPGAAIKLDDVDTGEVTDTVLTDIAPGSYSVSVEQAGLDYLPAAIMVTVARGDTATANFATTTGDLTVTSTPAGAEILIDGAPTGEVTPHTFALPPATYTVSVSLAGFAPDPASRDVTVIDGGAATADFTMQAVSAQKIVMLETFSNVSCVGCPEMSELVHQLQGLPAYGTDRVLYVKYSANWPSPIDPHYLANPTDNTERFAYYGYSSIPVLYVEGSRFGLAGELPTLGELQTEVDSHLAGGTDLRIEVSADLTDTTVPVDITLTALQNLDLTDHSLRVALVEAEITYDTPPGSEGETVFHWIMRDLDLASGDIGDLTALTPVDFAAQVVRQDGFVVEELYVMVMVQNNSSKAIVQAGSNIPVVLPVSGAARSLADQPHSYATSRGGIER